MDKIVVLDFGSQYSHLICRRIREANVYCELLPYNTPANVIKEIDPKGIIFSGGRLAYTQKMRQSLIDNYSRWASLFLEFATAIRYWLIILEAELRNQTVESTAEQGLSSTTSPICSRASVRASTAG